MTTTTSNSIGSSISSIDPQLVKLFERHHQQFQQFSIYFNQFPPNAIATNLPKHLLTNGSSKINSENFQSNIKSLPSNDSQIKKATIQQTKEISRFDQWLQPPIGSIIQVPPCLPTDRSSSSLKPEDLKSQTILSSGERITCFNVGGENRLCLPEILNTVLKEFSLQEINGACERLHIYCSRCTNEQLDILKMSKVLPINAPSCGLITQTDTERLCANLFQLYFKEKLRSVNSMGKNQYERLYSIKVQHKCFGKCSGTLYPTLYDTPDAECIQCDTCQLLLTTKTFVAHGHKLEENRICHWGFNSNNWRAYLEIRSFENTKARKEFDLFKDKFLKNNLKKKLSEPINCSTITAKRAKTIQTSSDLWNNQNFYCYPQSSFSSHKNDNTQGENSLNSCLSRRIGIPSTLSPLPTDTSKPTPTSCRQPSPSHIIRSHSPELNDQKNPCITNFNDFSADGIRQMVESTVSSTRDRHRLLTYINKLQLNAYAQSKKQNSSLNERDQNEWILLRRENENLREHLLKFESRQTSSNSNTISTNSKTSLNDHYQSQDNIVTDFDDLESNISSDSSLSLIAYETSCNGQAKHFDRKHRLLAAEQHLSMSQPDLIENKKSNVFKKTCLDHIVDSLNQKAQVEQEEICLSDENII